MRRTTLLSLTTVFSLLGIADAWYLAQHALTNTALSCGIDGALSGCNIVAQSVHSYFLGVPLGIYGLVFYTITFILAALAFRIQTTTIFRLLFGMGSIGIVFSLYFVGLQFFIIDAICIYCFASFLLSLGIFWTTYTLVRQQSVPSVALM